MASKAISRFVLAVSVVFLIGSASADCSQESYNINGNWYCQQVDRISYPNIGSSGKYDRVIGMDDGQCTWDSRFFSGSLSPLDEDVSIHLRGPLELKQFAVYAPPKEYKKLAKRFWFDRLLTKGSKDLEPDEDQAKLQLHDAKEMPLDQNLVVSHGRRQMQEQINKIQQSRHAAERRAAQEWITATINGQVVSWAKVEPKPTPQPAGDDWVTATINGNVVSWINQYHPTSAPNPAPPALPPPPAPPAPPAPPLPTPAPTAGPGSAPTSGPDALPLGPGDWTQIAYFNSESRVSHGVTFLNNMGGQGSGVFDTEYGNSLSYASPDGKVGSSYPELFDGVLEGRTELAIFSDRSCNDGSCGFSRPGSVAYHGFDGPEKAFFFEFGMPDDGSSGWNMNMPAIWSLNAQIPRTQQYGTCSCWRSGCGEFDIFEVLDSGNFRMKSTLHSVFSGGSSDYFLRPMVGTMKAMVIMNNDGIVIQVLPHDFVFPNSIGASNVTTMCDDSKALGLKSSFRVTG